MWDNVIIQRTCRMNILLPTLNRGAVCVCWEVGGGGSEGGERSGYIGHCNDTNDLPDEGRSLYSALSR